MKVLITKEAVNYLDKFIEKSMDRFPLKERPIQLQYYGKLK